MNDSSYTPPVNMYAEADIHLGRHTMTINREMPCIDGGSRYSRAFSASTKTDDLLYPKQVPQHGYINHPIPRWGVGSGLLLQQAHPSCRRVSYLSLHVVALVNNPLTILVYKENGRRMVSRDTRSSSTLPASHISSRSR